MAENDLADAIEAIRLLLAIVADLELPEGDDRDWQSAVAAGQAVIARAAESEVDR